MTHNNLRESLCSRQYFYEITVYLYSHTGNVAKSEIIGEQARGTTAQGRGRVNRVRRPQPWPLRPQPSRLAQDRR